MHHHASHTLSHLIVYTLTIRGAGTAGLEGGQMTLPQKFTWGVKHGILTPHFLERNIFWYTLTRCYWGYIIIILYSETRSRSMFFVIIYIRFVDSAKCGPHDFDPTAKIVPARLLTIIMLISEWHRQYVETFDADLGLETSLVYVTGSGTRCQKKSFYSHLRTNYATLLSSIFEPLNASAFH